MPVIRVELLKGRSIEQKREFAETVTREASRILKCAPDAVDVIFADVETENWAKAGRLMADKK